LKKILIIDDDQMMLNALTTLLETENYATLTSADGEGGIRLYKQHRPDVVLLDLRLPLKNGIEVLKDIKGIDSNAKIIIITGYPSPEVKEEAMGNGAFYFYEKSKDIGELLQAVQNAIGANPA
jgi:DNA-binding NtrC family response regulator